MLLNIIANSLLFGEGIIDCIGFAQREERKRWQSVRIIVWSTDSGITEMLTEANMHRCWIKYPLENKKHHFSCGSSSHPYQSVWVRFFAKDRDPHRSNWHTSNGGDHAFQLSQHSFPWNRCRVHLTERHSFKAQIWQQYLATAAKGSQNRIKPIKFWSEEGIVNQQNPIWSGSALDTKAGHQSTSPHMWILDPHLFVHHQFVYYFHLHYFTRLSVFFCLPFCRRRQRNKGSLWAVTRLFVFLSRSLFDLH